RSIHSQDFATRGSKSMKGEPRTQVSATETWFKVTKNGRRVFRRIRGSWHCYWYRPQAFNPLPRSSKLCFKIRSGDCGRDSEDATTSRKRIAHLTATMSP